MKTRTSPRQPLEALATCRDGHGRQWEALLADVSEGGCKLHDPASQLGAGERLNLFFANTGPHLAQVSWRRGDEVGIEFRSPLPEELQHSLAAQDWTASGADIPEASAGTDFLRFV